MLHRGTNRSPWTWEEAEAFCNKIFALDRPVELSIAGGEPTLSPQLKPLIKLFKDRGHRVLLTSNGSRSVDYWDEIDLDYLCLSYHPSWAQDDWLYKLEQLSKKFPRITARIMMDPDYWEQCLAMIDFILEKDLAVNLDPTRILDWGAAIITYDRLQELWFDQQRTTRKIQELPDPVKIYADTDQETRQSLPLSDFIRSGHNRFVGWQCNIGIDSLFVQFDGSIRKGNCEQDGYIGWLQDSDFQLPTEPTRCQVYLCHCGTDVKTAKERRPNTSSTIPIYRLPRTRR
jgi:hypothetical protein